MIYAMKKTILIPTDFTVQSLNVLKTILANNNTNLQFDIVLLHGVSLSDSIRDLLFYSKTKQIASLTNPAFEEAFEVIKNKFDSQINSMRIDLFTGYNQAAFNNYLEGNRVEQIVMTNQQLYLTNSKSFNLEAFIKKSNVDVFVIDAGEVATLPEKGKLAELFFNHAQVG
jgi:hypothetical protein